MSIEDILQPIKTRILNMIGRAVLNAAKVSEDGVTFQIDLLADETRDEVELFQQYGYASVPKKGAQGITVFVGGARDHGIIIATEDARYRLKGMKDGEVALYSDEGDHIHFKRGRIIDFETQTLNIKASKSVNFDTPQITSTGEISDNVGNLSALRDNYNKHKHIGNLGAPTSPPDSIDGGS